jgi:uncharacterized protein YwqG
VGALAGSYASEEPGNFDSERWWNAQSQGTGWRLALQIDFGETLDVMWGDVGTLFWMTRHADVVADRWDQCMLSFQRH